MYRENLPSVGAYEVVFRGNTNYFIDTTVESGEMYRYWMCKTRGVKLFENDDYICAAYDESYLKDVNDARDTIEQAHPFTTYQIADYVVYYNQAVSTDYSSRNNVLLDKDWYYSDLPPHTQKTIGITFNDVTQGTSGAPPSEKLYVMTEMTQSLSTSEEFSLYNATNAEKRVYFCVAPDPSAFTQYENIVDAPGARRIWWYKLHFKQLNVYNDVQ